MEQIEDIIEQIEDIIEKYIDLKPSVKNEISTYISKKDVILDKVEILDQILNEKIKPDIDRIIEELTKLELTKL